MKNRTIQFSLDEYFLSKIELKINPSFEWPKNQGIDMNPVFNRTIIRNDDNSAIVHLSIVISNDNLPFNLDMTISGKFSYPNWEKEELGRILMEENSISILFPYLRQAVSSVTSLAGFPPYILPVIDVRNFFLKH